MTTRLISNPLLWREHLEAGRRDAICDWLQANGLDPLAVLSTKNVTIEPAPNGGRQIRCTVIEPDATEPEPRVVPLVVPPPLDWPVHEAPPPVQPVTVVHAVVTPAPDTQAVIARLSEAGKTQRLGRA